MFINLMVGIWKKNIKWILLGMLVVGLALSVEKVFFTDTIVKSDRFHTEQVVSINFSDSGEIGSISKFEGILKSYTILNEFLAETEHVYDYSKFDKNFPDLSQEKKLEWLQNHLWITMGNRICLYGFHLPANTRKTDLYVNEYGNQFLQQYISFTQKKLNQLGLVSSYELGDNFTLEPQVIALDKKTQAIKYGIVGGILGGLLVMMILGIRSYFKEIYKTRD